MKIDFMRLLDRYLGVPLCVLLSVWNILRSVWPFKKAGKGNTFKKILFVKLSELGAIVVAVPLLKKAQEDFPRAEIFFLSFEQNKEVFDLLDGIVSKERILTISDRSLGKFVGDTFKVLSELRKKNIDIVFDLEMFSRFTAILSFLSGAVKRVGFFGYSFEGLYRGNLFSHRVPYNPLNHTGKSYLSLWQDVFSEKKSTPELKDLIGDSSLELPVYASCCDVRKQLTEKMEEWPELKERKIYLFNPGGGVIPLREWPLENYVALSDRILKDPQNGIIIIGAQKTDRTDDLFKVISRQGRCANLVGKTSLKELMELFHLAEALIANDCGIAHLAALTEIKKFILFGPESPQVFAPLGKYTWIIHSPLACSPCLSALNHRKSYCQDNQCLKMIKPDDVFNVIQKNQ